MQYKTIVLQLLEQHPKMYDQLRSQRLLLPVLDLCATDLKARHQTWKDRLLRTKPSSDLNQIASEALEIALKELEDRLLSESPPGESEPLSLDEAMAFLRRHTPPA